MLEKIFSMIEKKWSQHDKESILEDSLKNSIFGVFGTNYAQFINQHNKEETKAAISHCFAESNILEEPIHRALLYFNLPYDLIVKNVKKPRCLFDFEKNKTQKKIEDVLEAFEKEGN